MPTQVWATFFAVNLMASLAPGPGAVAAMHTGLAHGRAGVWRLVLGLQLALLAQLSLVAMGAGALLDGSALGFQLLRWGGAAYLVWLGMTQMLAAWRRQSSGQILPQAGWDVSELIWRGVLVNLANPKAILFMAALVPQFIDPGRPLAWQYTVIAVTMCSTDALVMGGYGLMAARLRPWLESPRLARRRDLLFGALFVGFGLALLGFERAA